MAIIPASAASDPSFLSRLWFWWLTKDLLRWTKDPTSCQIANLDTTGCLPAELDCAELAAQYKLLRAKHPRRGLLRTLFGMFYIRWLASAFCYVVWCTSCGIQPLLLERIVRYIKDDAPSDLRPSFSVSNDTASFLNLSTNEIHSRAPSVAPSPMPELTPLPTPSLHPSSLPVLPPQRRSLISDAPALAREVDIWEGLVPALLLIVSNIAYFLSISWKFHLQSINGVATRGLLMWLIFDKSLKLHLVVDEKLGTATNVMSNDSEAVFQGIMFSHYTWLSPLFVLVIFAWMCAKLGVAAVVGFGLLLLSIPLNGLLGKMAAARKRGMMKAADGRTEMTSQICTGIQAVKCNAWEDAFGTKLGAMRETELGSLFACLLLKRLSITV